MSFAYLATCTCGKRSSFTSAKKISRIQCSACKALISVELRDEAAKQLTTPPLVEKTVEVEPVVQPSTPPQKNRYTVPAIIASGLVLLGASVAVWWFVPSSIPGIVQPVKSDDEDDMMVVRTSLNPSEAVNKSLLPCCVWILSAKQGNISCGSGVLVDHKNRIVVTNDHVVNDADEVVVVFPLWKNGELVTNPSDYVDKKKNAKTGITAKVVKKAARSDLALIQVQKLPDTAVACPLAKEPAKAGAKIYTIGNANSLDAFNRAKSSVLFTFASGDVRQRSNGPMTWKIGTDEYHAVSLTTTLPINPGDSGGPVVSIQQQQLALVGVNQSKDLSRTNMTYIVDRDEIQSIMKDYYQSANATPATVPPILVQDELVVTKVDIGKLLERLDSDDASLQRRALSRLKKHADNSVAEVLEKLPKTLTRLVELNTQSETSKDMQRMCLSLLTKIDKPGAEDTRPLQLALLSKNPELREQALRLIEASDVKLIGSLGKPIMQLLDPEKEKNTLNRQRCLRLLIKLKENAPAEALETCLNICFDDDDSEMRLLAATGAKELTTVLSRDQVSLMKKALKNDRRSGVRQPLLSICSRQQAWCAKELIDELIAILQQDSDPTTLAEVAKTLKLAEIKFPYDDKANNALAELWRWLPKLTGPEQHTFINVLQSVMCFEPTSLHGHLNEIIKNPGSIRPLAAPSLHSLINTCLLHSNPDVRNTALLAVLNTGESIRPACENAVRSIAEYDTKLDLRKKAVVTLHAMKSKNQETFATLLKVQQMKQTSEESEQELALMSAKILEALQYEPIQAVTLSTGYLPSIMQTLRWAAYSGPEYEPAMVWMIQAISAHQQSAEMMCPYLLAFLFQDKYTKAADAAEIALIKLEERVVPALCASYLLIRIEEGNRGLLAQHLIQRHISNEAVAMKRFYDQSNSHEDFLQLIDNIERRFDIKQQMIRVLKTSLPEERRLINIMHKLSKPVQSRVLSLMRQQSVYVQTRRYSDVMALACCQLLSHLEADVVELLEKHASDFGATAVSGMTRLDFISAIGMNMYRQKDSAKKLAAMKALERLQTLYEQKVDEHMKRSSQGVGDFAELRDCVKAAKLMMDTEPTLVLKGRRYGSKPIGNSRPK